MQATQAIDLILSRLSLLQQREIFFIQRKKRRDVITAWHQLKGRLKETIVTFRVDVREVQVMGSTEALREIREWLSERNFLTTPNSDPGLKSVDPQDCNICYCPVEYPAYYYQGCGHGGCQS